MRNFESAKVSQLTCKNKISITDLKWIISEIKKPNQIYPVNPTPRA